MAPVKTMKNILMELRKVCQHPYLSAPELENEDLPQDQQQEQLVEGSGKLAFLKLLLPKLKERGHRVLLFSQFKIALDRIEDFMYGEGYKFLRLDGDVPQAERQKSMDKFNAPDSEFFIFLLTTRAGGVGINLATADTVIVYDPDFNPHMDLQAIARSHRYGQKKRVMVFKLMMKNSVEEQIILNGKKKMVLDHLVVQQMGKDSEEGEIDSMLLHGAAALYESNEDGIAASGIRYTAQDVENLIERVQQDAEVEAIAMEKRDKAKVDRVTEPEEGEEAGAAKAKETMSFGFAKIWEHDQSRLQEVDENEAVNAEEMDNAWKVIMENAKKAQAARDAGALVGRRRLAASKVKYGLDASLSDGSPHKANKKGKKKRKSDAIDSSDADFQVRESESESESDSDGGIRELDPLSGEPVVSKKPLANPLLSTNSLLSALTPEQKLAIARAQEMVMKDAAEGNNATADPSTIAQKPEETPEERSARLQAKKQKKAERSQRAYESMLQNGAIANAVPAPQQPRLPPMPEPARPQSPEKTQPITAPAAPPRSVNGTTASRGNLIVAGAQIAQAIDICYWLYHVLLETGDQKSVMKWGLMGVPEIDGDQRKSVYLELAEKTDSYLMKTNPSGGTYFTSPAQVNAVLPVLLSGRSIMPDSDDYPIPPIPEQFKRRPLQAHRTLNNRNAEASLPQPYQETSVGPIKPSDPLPGPSRSTPVPAVAIPETAAPGHGVQIISSQCAQPGHTESDCRRQPSKVASAAPRTPESTNMALPGIEAHLDEIRRPEEVRMGTSTSSPHVAPDKQTPPKGTMGTTSLPGSREAAIVVEDNDEPTGEVRPSKRARSAGPDLSGPCTFCQGNQEPLRDCPIVKLGPVTIESSLSRRGPEERSGPAWKSLCDHLEAAKIVDSSGRYSGNLQHPCPFCRAACGYTISQCAINRAGGVAGGRKALKASIRQAGEEERAASPQSKDQAAAIMKELFDCYSYIESSDDEHVRQDFRGLSEMDQGIGTSSRPAYTARSLHQTSTRPRTSSTRRPRAETPLFYPRSSSSFSPDKAPTVSTDPLALSSERDEASDFEVIGGLDRRYGQASSDGESVMVVPRTVRKGKGKEKARQFPPTPSESMTSSSLRFPPIMRSAAPQDVVVEIPFMSLSTLRTYKHDNPLKRPTHKSRDKTLQQSSARGDPSSSTSSFTPLTVMAKPKRAPPSRRAVNIPSRWSPATKAKPSSDGEYGPEESEGDQEGDVELESEDELAMRRSKRTRVNSRGREKAGQRDAKAKPKEWALRERNRPRHNTGDSIASSYSHHRSIRPTRSPRRSMRKQAEDSDGSEPDDIQEQAGSSEPEGEDEIEEYQLEESEVDSEEDRLVVEPEVKFKALQQHRPLCEKCSRERADVMLEKATKRKLKSGKRKKQDDDEISDGEQAHLLLGWLECEKCVISSHWNCLGAGQQKQVLSDLLDKEGPPDAGDKPRRSLGIDEQATFVCTRCTADPSCFECHEEKVVDEAAAPANDKGGDIKMKEEDVPLDPKKPRAEEALLFRCHRCHSSCHYEHMKPVEGDGPESLPERAEHYQRAQKKVDAWQCHKCREWPWTVDIICAWRPLSPGAQNLSEKLDEKPDYKEALPREYLVKWTFRGFRHATWVPHWWLKEIARQKLRSFLEKGPALNLITDQTLAAAGDDIAEPTIAKVMAEDDRVNGSRSKGHHNQPDQWQGHGPAPDANAEASIPSAWRTVDRVLDVMLVPSKLKAKPKPKHQALKRGGRVLSISASPSPFNNDEDVQIVAPQRPDGMEPPSTDRMDIDVWEESTGKILSERDIDTVAPLVTWCLVKWDDLQYDQSCWDTPPPADSPLYPAFKHGLERYLKARQVVIPVLTSKQRQAREAEAARVREPPTEQPACLVGGTLMPFQMEGFQWLLYKYFRRESCILADDMGLGKTVQISSLLGYLGSDEFKIYPCLVVVPNSTITNWVREFEKWVPHLRVVPYYGEAASRKVISQYELYHKGQQGKAVGLKAHIVLTTYDMITGNEFRVFSDIPRWEMLCVDEGQRLKSDSNLIFNRLKTLNTVHRILLTGTPLNNNLRELFNLLNFLDKETFKDLADLEARFADLNEGLIQELHEMIKPYILRRIKADVLKLPPKIEIIVPISLTPLQKSVYKGILEKNAEILKAVTEARRKRAPKAIAPAIEPQDTAKP